jgi:Leucine-rich repeat (LRR) protein
MLKFKYFLIFYAGFLFINGVCSCIFEKCECIPAEHNANAIRVNCTNQENDIVGLPKKNPNYNGSKSIDKLLIKGYNSTEMPTELLANLDIIILELKNNHMKKITKDAFKGITKLQRLSIEDPIEEIVEESLSPIRNTLDTLELTGVKIDNTKLNKIMDQIKTLNGLVNLSIRNYLFESLNNELLKELKNLITLDLSKNNLKSLDEAAFKNNPKLTYLSLAENKLDSLNSVVKALEPLKKTLLDLYLSKNELKTIEDTHFEGFLALYSLSLAENQIDKIGNKSFDTNKDLYELDLSGNSLSTLPNIKKLQRLNSLNVGNQKGKLKSLRDYEFDREYGKNPIYLYLDNNDITIFANKTFCSPKMNTQNLALITIEYKALKTVDKCIFKQLKPSNKLTTLNVVDSLSHANHSDLCNCNMHLFLQENLINLGGICSSILASKPCSVLDYKSEDDCHKKSQFFCNSATANGSGYFKALIFIAVSLITFFKF